MTITPGACHSGRGASGTNRGAPIYSEDDMTALPLARNTDPGTSHSAAAAFLPLVKEHEARILAALVRPMTCYELADATGLDHVAVARRMRKLADESKVRETDSTRAGPNGRQCIVWEKA